MLWLDSINAPEWRRTECRLNNIGVPQCRLRHGGNQVFIYLPVACRAIRSLLFCSSTCSRIDSAMKQFGPGLVDRGSGRVRNSGWRQSNYCSGFPAAIPRPTRIRPVPAVSAGNRPGACALSTEGAGGGLRPVPPAHAESWPWPAAGLLPSGSSSRYSTSCCPAGSPPARSAQDPNAVSAPGSPLRNVPAAGRETLPPAAPAPDLPERPRRRHAVSFKVGFAVDLSSK